MKSRKPLTSVAVFGLAFCVTTMSMYSAVGAAAQDETAVAPIEFSAGEVATSPEVAASPSVIELGSALHNRQHEVTLDGNGGFNGRLSSLSGPNGNLSPAAEMTVKIIQQGNAVTSTTTDAEGGFSVTGLNEGVVGLLAYGKNGLLLHAIRLKNSENTAADATPVESDDSLEIALSSNVVCPADVALAQQLLLDGMPGMNVRSRQAGTNLEKSESELTRENSGTSPFPHQVQVQLRPDGTLTGEVNLLAGHREIVDLTLHFLRNGEHVGATEVAPTGRFVMAGLTPGVYSIVTTGNDGALAMGIDVVGSLAQRNQNSKYKLASIAQQLELAVAPVSAENFNTSNASQLTDGTLTPTNPNGAGAPVVGGPMAEFPGGPVGGLPGGGVGSGGLGGGGGGVGGGGGLGALLAAGAAGAIGYAIGNDDNTPASPAR